MPKSAFKQPRRRTTRKQREAAHRNALKGTEEWENMTHKERVSARNSRNYSWGFEGKSPRTRKRIH